MSSGKIVQVIGPVVDLEFPAGKLPAIYNAVHIPLSTKEKPGDGGHLTVEVASHLGDSLVRAISLGPTEGLQRGMEAIDTGAPLTVPVGRGTAQHFLNPRHSPNHADDMKRQRLHRAG